MLEQGTRMHNYLMPQDRAVLEQVQSMSAPLELDPVTAAVGELTVPATATEEEARRNPANYTPVLDTPFYPFENPWGNGGSWDIPGDEQGNVLKIDYEFGGESRTGLIFPAGDGAQPLLYGVLPDQQHGQIHRGVHGGRLGGGRFVGRPDLRLPLLHQSAFGRTDRLDGARRGPDDLL